MFSALLLMSLLLAPQTTTAGQMPTLDEAAALAREGHYDAALDAFRRLAARDARDQQARLWIARLHGWMGHPELAEPVYRSVLLEDPANLDAMVGVGMTLVALGRIEEGVEVLERAERAQPQNPQVLDALGRAYTLEGRTTRALLYAERAWGVAPTEINRQAFEQARLIHGHRVQISSFGERYNTPTPDTGSVDLRANFRLREDLRLVVRGQHQRKFGFSEQRGGGGLEWQWRRRTMLFGQVLGGPQSNEVLPRVDATGEIAHTEGRTQLVAGYRFFDFPSAQVSVVSPGMTWWPSDRVSIGARYYLSFTDRPTLTTAEQDHSVALRTAYRLAPRVWMEIGYGHGTENFDTLSPDRVVDFDANTVSGGLRIHLPTLTSVVGTYEHQWRRSNIEMQRLTIGLMQRF